MDPEGLDWKYNGSHFRNKNGDISMHHPGIKLIIFLTIFSYG